MLTCTFRSGSSLDAVAAGLDVGPLPASGASLSAGDVIQSGRAAPSDLSHWVGSPTGAGGSSFSSHPLQVKNTVGLLLPGADKGVDQGCFSRKYFMFSFQLKYPLSPAGQRL